MTVLFFCSRYSSGVSQNRQNANTAPHPTPIRLRLRVLVVADVRREEMKKRVLIIAACLAALIGIAYLHFSPPLFPALTARATCTVGGNPVNSVRVFAPLFVTSVHYIRLPQPVDKRYQWFLVRWSKQSVSTPIAIWKADSVFRHVHRDQIKGINLQHPKIEDTWRVVFDKTTVQFSNGKIDIEVKR